MTGVPRHTLLAIALLAIAAPAAAAPIRLDPAQIADGGVVVAPPRAIVHRPSRRGYGIVVDAGAALALHARIAAAAAQEHLAAIQAQRTRSLFGRAGNVSQASVQQAEAAETVAGARLEGLRATARARYGDALGNALIHDGGPLSTLRRGGSLVEVSVPGAKLSAPPSTALARGDRLRLIGAAGHVSSGVLGESLYYSGPALPAGTPLPVTLPLGPARHGYLIPAAAALYGRHGASLYVETAQGQFSPVRLPTNDRIRRHGVLQGYFLPDGALPAGARLVIRGAGLLRSIDHSVDRKSSALPVGD